MCYWITKEYFFILWSFYIYDHVVFTKIMRNIQNAPAHVEYVSKNLLPQS